MANKIIDNKKVSLSFLKELLVELLQSDEAKALLKQIILDILKEMGAETGTTIPDIPTTDPNQVPKKKWWKTTVEYIISLLPTILSLFLKKKTTVKTVK
jgi:hypothetical protein